MIHTHALEAPQRVAISLSREELYIVMRLIRATHIPGFDLDWLTLTAERTPTEEMQRALEVATNALVARGYLAATNQQADSEKLALSIPSPVVALVGACAFGEYSLALPTRNPDGARLLYLHELRGLGVIHSMPVPGIHQFEAVEGRAGIVQALDQALALHEQQASHTLATGYLTGVALQAARDAAFQDNVEEATRILIRDGLSSNLASVLAEAMHRSACIGAILIASRTADGQQREAALAVIITAEYCFQLSEAGSSPSTFEVRSVSAHDLRQHIFKNMADS